MFIKLRANAMYFAILISAIVAILLSTFILLIHLHQKTRIQTEKISKNFRKIDLIFNDINSTNKSEFRKESFWGGFKLVTISSGESPRDFQKTALIGSELNPSKDPVLYLQDRNMPLVIAGRTKIDGKLEVPGGFLKTGSVDGNYFTGVLPNLNLLGESDRSLPTIDKEWLTYVDSLRNTFPDSDQILVDLSESFINSFSDKPRWLIQRQGIHLHQNLIGNIIIRSEDYVIIEPDSKLEDVIIIAPKVLIKSRFTGSIHILSEEISMESHVVLKYPSSITIPAGDVESLNTKDYKLSIGLNSVIHGNIILFTNDLTNKKHLLIPRGSEVVGGVYNQGYTDLRGEIRGELYTTGFAAHVSGSVYINHLYGANIHQSPSGIISGIPLKKREKVIAKWMY